MSTSTDCPVTVIFDHMTNETTNHELLCPPSTDCADSPGGGGGLLPVVAASPHSPPVGGVWLFPSEPGLFRVQDGGSLLGLQQLIRQPHHLRFPVRELQEFVQAGFLVPDAQQVPCLRHQGAPQQSGDGTVH